VHVAIFYAEVVVASEIEQQAKKKGCLLVFSNTLNPKWKSGKTVSGL
jgi:hypothetical protein